jgi:hypothetical protein
VTVGQTRTAKSNRRVFTIILLVLVFAWIGTAIFGFFIVRNVRETAARTDGNMRALAWAAIVFACEHEGRFPVDEEELFSVGTLPDSIPCVPVEEGAWPVTLEHALGSAKVPDLVTAARDLQLHFSSEGTLPPVVGNNGLPTQLGTQDEIRGWLRAFDEASTGTVK